MDGKPYAQPLYMHHVNFPVIGAKNVVFIATENNTVFAYDADDPNAMLLWQQTLNVPGQRAIRSDQTKGTNPDISCGDISPKVGISSTPVISCGCNNTCCGGNTTGCCSSSMYITNKSIGINDGTFHIFLHALDIITGHDRPGSPVEITGQVNGTGDGNDGKGHIIFNAKSQNNRPGLLLLNGCVYIGFASHCDGAPYHGWVIAYDSTTLVQKAIFCTTPNGGDGGIWQGEFGLASDGDAIFVSTGNGTFDINSGGIDYGDSVLKLAPNLKVLSWFTPADEYILNPNDVDLGSGGVMVIPGMQQGAHPNLAVMCGKDGNIMLLDRDALGGYSGPTEPFWDQFNSSALATRAQYPGNNPNAVFTILLQPLAPTSQPHTPNPQDMRKVFPAQNGVWGGPAYYNGLSGQYIFYAGGESRGAGVVGPLTAFELGGQRLTQQGVSMLTFDKGGTTPIVSSNNQVLDTAIVWAVRRNDGSSLALCAYNAEELGNTKASLVAINEISFGGWDTGSGDHRAMIEPTVVNGKVYVASQFNVHVFYCEGEFKVQ